MSTQSQRGRIHWFVWVVILIAFLAIASAVVFVVATLGLCEPSWADCKRTLEARGARLDAKAFIPPPVPDDQNFAMTPFLKPLFDFKPGTHTPRDTNAVERIKNFANVVPPCDWSTSWSTANRLDLVAYAQSLQASAIGKTPDVKQRPRTARELAAAAPQMLAALKPFDPVIEELRAASRRPFARFPLWYDDPCLIQERFPHLQTLKHACQVLMLRASAKLAAGQAEQALGDLELLFRLLDTIKDEPCLLSQLVRTGCFMMALQVVWEGLAEHGFSENQLRALQSRLSAYDFLGHFRWALEAERACLGNGTFEFLRRQPNELEALFSLASVPSPAPAGTNRIVNAVLHRWLQCDQNIYNREFEERIFPALNVTVRRVYPKLADESSEAVDAERCEHGVLTLFWRHRVVTNLALPDCALFVRSFAHAQTSADEAAIACALERWRLAEGTYPETLDALVPRFIGKLPHDIITGQRLKYRRTDGGVFVLYSVGWNEVDDGGKRPVSADGLATPAVAEGDWVWRYPAAQ